MKKVYSFRFWDWKSINRTIFVFTFIIVALAFGLFYPSCERESKAIGLTETTTAELIAFKPVNIVTMGHEGNELIVPKYEVKYRYKVNSKTYNSTDVVPNRVEFSKTITYLSKERPSTIRIKYDPYNPGKSQIVTK